MHREKTKILLAEDDLNLGILLVDYLESEGFEVKLCKDGEIALNTFKKDKFDICLLDVMMSKVDGFSLANEIKKLDDKIPFIFITAKSLMEDKLKGYNLGADDYITKPFDEVELYWKIKAIIRRIPSQENLGQTEIVAIGKYKFDFSNQALSFASTTKRITERESEILKYLSERRNRIVKREEMLKDLWGENDYFYGRSLDVFITKIRKYLSDDSDLSIENVFKVGFVFNVPK